MKKWPYISVMVLLIALYLVGQYCFNIPDYTTSITTIIAIIAAVAFWMEFKNTKRLNESRYVVDLNNQFLSNDKLSKVEWELEKYYHNYMVAKAKGESVEEIQFDLDFSLEKEERQWLVNYLVHLEGMATLVDRGVLEYDTIVDLMSYRYFIAMNNPAIQKLELLPYKNYYQNCYRIYDTWCKSVHSGIPMAENNLTEQAQRYTEKSKKHL